MAERKLCVAADASEQNCLNLSRLLEENFNAEVISVHDGPGAVEAVCGRTVDYMLISAVLPGMDGAGTAERIRRLPLRVQPGVVILKPAGLAAPVGEELLRQGVCVLEKPFSAQELMLAMEKTCVQGREISRAKRVLLERLLDDMGMPEHPGRGYMARCVELACQDQRLMRKLTAELYPLAARSFQTDVRRVERSMRHCLEKAWQSGAIDKQYEIFGGTIDAQRGKPTCGEAIARLADILRMEG